MTRYSIASTEWIESVRGVLQSLVDAAGPEIETADFSICEVFTDPPSELLSPGQESLSWHFKIKGRTVSAKIGEIDDVDLKVQMDFQSARPLFKFVHGGDPEKIEELESMAMKVAMAGKAKVKGNKDKRPDALEPLHDMIARFTA